MVDHVLTGTWFNGVYVPIIEVQHTFSTHVYNRPLRDTLTHYNIKPKTVLCIYNVFHVQSLFEEQGQNLDADIAFLQDLCEREGLKRSRFFMITTLWKEIEHLGKGTKQIEDAQRDIRQRIAYKANRKKTQSDIIDISCERHDGSRLDALRILSSVARQPLHIVFFFGPSGSGKTHFIDLLGFESVWVNGTVQAPSKSSSA